MYFFINQFTKCQRYIIITGNRLNDDSKAVRMINLLIKNVFQEEINKFNKKTTRWLQDHNITNTEK